jgi:hypothetical protein
VQLMQLQAPSEKNTLVFKLDVTCSRQGTRIVNEKGALAKLVACLDGPASGAENPLMVLCNVFL